MPDQEQPPRAGAVLRSGLPALAADAVTAGAALAVAGPGAATIVGISAGARVAWSLSDVARDRFWGRAGRAIDVAADTLGIPADEVGERAQADDARLELVRRVVEAAGRSTIEEKVDALGRVLARGLDGDDAEVDVAFLLARALDAVEGPHVRVLQALPTGEHDRRPAADELADAAPGTGQAMGALLALLEGQHLVEQHRPGFRDFERRQTLAVHSGGSSFPMDERRRYSLTDLGRELLALLTPTPEARGGH